MEETIVFSKQQIRDIGNSRGMIFPKEVYKHNKSENQDEIRWANKIDSKGRCKTIIWNENNK